MSIRIRAAAAASMFLAITITGYSLSAADLLTIGSPAPDLSIEHWVQDNGGQLKPVTKFEKGKVYIVEFWATWCGPCVQSMPHLAELQQKYADRGVRVISVSNEPLERVQNFLAKPAEGITGPDPAAPPTFADITRGYSLTTDPDNSTYVDYMDAAAQNAIPAAFIVGKDAKIEWLGHPMQLDGPLEAVLNDSWDREAFAAQIREQQLLVEAQREIQAAMQAGKPEQAIKTIDGLLSREATKNNPPLNVQLNLVKFQILVVTEQTDAALEHLQRVFAEFKDPQQIDGIAWNVYHFAREGAIKDPRMLTTAIAAARAAQPQAEKEIQASLLDTIGHILAVQGKLDEAIATEKQALELAGPQQRETIQQFLSELQTDQTKEEDR